MQALLQCIEDRKIKSLGSLLPILPARAGRTEWLNIGGQLIPAKTVATLKERIKKGSIKSWDAVHSFYATEGKKYEEQKLQHALASLSEITGMNLKKLDKLQLESLLHEFISTKQWMADGIYQSRAKDYESSYRTMVYDTKAEMDKVMGTLANNSFIKQQQEDLTLWQEKIAKLRRTFYKA